MSQNISVQQSVNCTNFFLGSQNENSEGKFNRDLLKRLTQTDRRLLIEVSKVFKRAQCEDFNDDIPINTLDNRRIEDFLSDIKKPLNLSIVTYPWYVRPFAWVADKITSIWKGILNLCNLRVSTQEICNQVESVRQEYSNAVRRVPEIEMSIKSKSLQIQKIDESKKSISEEMKKLVDVNERPLHQIFLDGYISGIKNRIQELSSEKKEKASSTKYKDVFSNGLKRYCAGIFPELEQAAGSIQSTDDDLNNALNREMANIKDKMNKNIEQIRVMNEEIKKLEMEKTELKSEIGLLHYKFSGTLNQNL